MIFYISQIVKILIFLNEGDLPWYMSTWGHLVFGGIALLLAFLFFQFLYADKIRQLEKKLDDKNSSDSKELAEVKKDLNNIQLQLMHAEKMASLGELSAGIAHEIQNPLNFVNNFSEVSSELLVELKEELKKGETEQASLISDDLIQNLEKISHHGKRASVIVRGMLDHSRAGSDEKVLTNINELCDEYLRLSFHGLRAKDKSFNSAYETNFDDQLPEILILPQNIGRVILNLLNNAFYSVNKKYKNQLESKESDSYKPMVSISTKKMDDMVRIVVKDNGLGIPEDLLEKVFQPFFTTKPVGSGTGLGLSLSFEIIKEHGGKINAHSVEGESTEFLIDLPIHTKEG